MFIKEVVISGFKSYKTKTVIENFHPGYNVVVGRNGSGKSNFFAALEFALRPESRALKVEERNALLYHGNVADVAFVEVVFDNEDRKLPYDSDTVTFRRLIGTKRDRFFVNQKENQDVKQFLDSAGFTNSYYIVKQGKINEMASLTDKSRLEVLYDISGSKEFDRKIVEALKTLEDSQRKWESAEKLLKDIDDNFENLQEQSECLEKVLKLEKKKRALEYIVHNREKVKTTEKKSQLQERHNLIVARCEPTQQMLTLKNKEIEEKSKEIAAMEQQILLLEHKKKDIDFELLSISEMNAKVENQLRDADETFENAIRSEEDIKKIDKRLLAAQGDLATCLQKISDIKNKETKQLDMHNSSKAELLTLKEKCGRSAQFRTKVERDKWIRAEIRKLNDTLKEKNDQRVTFVGYVEKIKSELNTLAARSEVINEEWEAHRAKLKDLEISVLRTDYDANVQKQRTLWSKGASIAQKLNTAKENADRHMDMLRKDGNNNAVTGWRNVHSILENFRENGTHQAILDGYWGIVLENIKCDPAVNTAVEVAAGAKLFHHIVQDHTVSRVIMTEFNRQKFRGEINFISLAEIRSGNREYPESTRDCTPLVEQIQFLAAHTPAMKFVFGGTLLCKTLEVACDVSKRFGFNCVTLDGDKVLSNGPITGGYHNRLSSKINVCIELTNEKSRMHSLSNEQEKIREQHVQLEFEITLVTKAKEKLELNACSIRSEFEKLQLEKDLCERKVHYQKCKLEQEQKALERIENSLKDITLKKSLLEEELTENLAQQSSQAMRRMKQLRQDLATTLKAAEQVTAQRKKKETQKKMLEKSIRSMEKRIEELKILGASASATEILKSDFKNQLSRLAQRKMKQEAAWERTNTGYMEMQEKMTNLKVDKEKLLDELATIQKSLDRVTKDLERLFLEEAEISAQLSALHDLILKLGTIPGNLQKYENTPTNDLCRSLKSLSEDLKMMGSVNRTATEKLERIQKVRETLVEDTTKYNEIHSKIMELKDSLEDKKGDAVFKSFQVIHEQFRKIFLKMVPKGNIRMRLLTEDGGHVDVNSVIDGEDGDPMRDLFRKNAFAGVVVDVNFLGKQLKNSSNNSLRSYSGGQKSLISLALLLAIQKCDPVPLYIFDEVDQALDKKYRSAVADLIKELSAKAQFICTTFSRQFIDKADAAFGVKFGNQVSKITPISIQIALTFVKNEADSSESDQNTSINSEEVEETNRRRFRTLTDLTFDSPPPPFVLPAIPSGRRGLCTTGAENRINESLNSEEQAEILREELLKVPTET